MKIQATGPWTIIGAVVRPSKYSGNDYTHVTMTNAQGQRANTNIGSDFNNNSQWQTVLQAYDDDNTVVIDNIFYKTKNNKIVLDSYTDNPVIDADSRPSIISASPDLQRQQIKQERSDFNQRKLQEVIDSGIEYKNGHWDITPYIVRQRGETEFNYVEELNPSASDSIDTIRDKLRIKSVIRYADMLNQGLHGNS